MLPLEFEPILKSIRWGGTRLGSLLGKPLGALTDVAESWEVADQPDARSKIISGEHAGQTLHDLIDTHPRELFGAQGPWQQFPLLIKFLDANDRLSVQVHPDDHMAVQQQAGTNGKTEAWFILHAEPGSQVFVGLKSGVTRSELEAAIEGDRVADLLHSIEVQAGDTIFVPAGTVHAIGEGIVLAEVQQQSNVTYRIHDWGRLGSDGSPRELHVAAALECIDFERGPGAIQEPVEMSPDDSQFELVRCDYFAMDRLVLRNPTVLFPAEAFRVLMVTGGSGKLACQDREFDLTLGKTLMLPASCPEAVIAPDDLCEVLHISVP